jgi:hypothetical protein
MDLDTDILLPNFLDAKPLNCVFCHKPVHKTEVKYTSLKVRAIGLTSGEIAVSLKAGDVYGNFL